MRFDDLPEGQLGGHRVATGLIRLDQDLPAEAIPATLRHELCHAVWAQRDLAKHPISLTEDVDRILRDAGHPLHTRLSGYRKGQQESELFANVCDRLPVWVHALGDPCPQGSHSLRRAARLTVSEGFLGDTRLTDQPVDLRTLGHAANPLPDGIPVAGPLVNSPQWLALVVARGEEVEHLVLDLRLGLLDEAPGSWNPAALQLPLPAPLPDGLDIEAFNPLGPVESGARTATVGDRAVVALPAYQAFPKEAPRVRLMNYADGAWTIVPNTCFEGQQSVFATEDHLGAVWSTPDGLLGWGVLD